MLAISTPAAGKDFAPVETSEIDAAYAQAVQVIRRCIHPQGLKASARKQGHRQVWARDSMISLLGASLADDQAIRSALLASLDTLESRQAASGCIPNHVDVETGEASFRAYADGGLWYVIGSSILRPNSARMARALRWYACQDVDQTGLLSIQEASDWQDLFCTRGKGLYVNCLHAIALEKAAGVAESRNRRRAAAALRKRAACSREAINKYLWYDGGGDLLPNISYSFSTPNLRHDSLGRERWIPPKRILRDDRYYLAYASFREVGEWFDSLGNLMAILAGVADASRAREILDFIARHGLAVHPMQAIFPQVQPGDPDWRPYYHRLNVPGHYHNGGVWPFLGGFYIAALVKTGRLAEASDALARLAKLNCAGGFNEWHEGKTAEPMGVYEQAWSAGMYLFAAECVGAGRVPYL